jgi:hypothetical protein
MFEEADPEFQTMAFFKTKISVRNALQVRLYHCMFSCYNLVKFRKPLNKKKLFLIMCFLASINPLLHIDVFSGLFLSHPLFEASIGEKMPYLDHKHLFLFEQCCYQQSYHLIKE